MRNNMEKQSAVRPLSKSRGFTTNLIGKTALLNKAVSYWAFSFSVNNTYSGLRLLHNPYWKLHIISTPARYYASTLKQTHVVACCQHYYILRCEICQQYSLNHIWCGNSRIPNESCLKSIKSTTLHVKSSIRLAGLQLFFYFHLFFIFLFLFFHITSISRFLLHISPIQTLQYLEWKKAGKFPAARWTRVLWPARII